MKNTFGSSVSITLFGESHGPKIGAVLDGLAPGIPVDEDLIRHQLALRRPAGRISTARQEQDAFEIVSGVFEGRTTGGEPFGRDTRIIRRMPNITDLKITGEADISAAGSRRR